MLLPPVGRVASPHLRAYATLMEYGFVQYVIGYLAGYMAGRLIYYHDTPNKRFTVEEIIPIINHRAVDSEEEVEA
jgi:hypothetical protein